MRSQEKLENPKGVRARQQVGKDFEHLKRYLAKKDFDLPQEKMRKLTSYLKKKSEQHKKKKSSSFSRENIIQFLRNEESVGIKLRTKIILIFGTFRLGRMEELAELHWSDIKWVDKGFSRSICRAARRSRTTRCRCSWCRRCWATSTSSNW